MNEESTPTPPQQKSGKATASLVSVLSACFQFSPTSAPILGVLGIILGILGLKTPKRTRAMWGLGILYHRNHFIHHPHYRQRHSTKDGFRHGLKYSEKGSQPLGYRRWLPLPREQVNDEAFSISVISGKARR